MPTIYVKPRAGGRVRMPERNYKPMPPAGDWVPLNDFWERLRLSGDVIECAPPAVDQPATSEPVAPPAPKPGN